MKILLRHVTSGKKEYVNLAGVPQEGDEIHWENRIVKVCSVKWFPLSEGEEVACLYVIT